ncbi:MAG: PAS domain-containing protein [Ginsengibacter sp.]
MSSNSEKKGLVVNGYSSAVYSKTCMRVSDHVNAMLSYWDKKGICRFANNACLQWFGKVRGEMVGIISMKELPGTLYEQYEPFINKALAGKKQVFEHELTLPDGSLRHYLATLSPDLMEGEVIGFFVHVANINFIKHLEAKLLKSEKAKRREVLRSVIETQESERELIAYELRDKVNQTLAYTKMMLGTASKGKAANVLLETISHNIHETIVELNRISSNLTPTVITMIGFKAGVKEYIDNFKKRYVVEIYFKSLDKKIEDLTVNDKISIFRIIQNYLLILSVSPACNIIYIEIRRSHSRLILRMNHNNTKFTLPVQSKEFMDIEHRLEYYDGFWQESEEENKKNIVIDIHVPAGKT